MPSTEFALIAAIRRRAGTHSAVPIGIGDDAALLAAPAASGWLVAADMLLEGRHFTVPPATARMIGRKTLAVNLSDIAATAGKPVAAFVSVAHHRSYGPGFAAELQEGIADLADEYGVAIAGGDTNVWDGPVVAGVTLLAETVGGRAVTRAGAKVGDVVMVTGPLGGSLASGRHLTFTPRIAAATALHAAVDLHAMIDISDGLLADLGHICEESSVGALLDADAVPIHDNVPPGTPLARLTQALTDGEDFELAFCVSPDDAARLSRSPPEGVAVCPVGKIVAGSGVSVCDAAGLPLTFMLRGWEHAW